MSTAPPKKPRYTPEQFLPFLVRNWRRFESILEGTEQTPEQSVEEFAVALANAFNRGPAATKEEFLRRIGNPIRRSVATEEQSGID